MLQLKNLSSVIKDRFYKNSSTYQKNVILINRILILFGGGVFIKNKKMCANIFIIAVLVAAMFLSAGCTSNTTDTSQKTMKITDSLGREVTVPVNPTKVICSGSGCLRYLTYLQAHDKIVGVDDIEKGTSKFDVRPYAIANRQFRDYPIFGEFRGKDDPEKIIALNPQIIFKVQTTIEDADKLQTKTGIPVVALNYGDLGKNRSEMYKTWRIMAKVMNKEARVEEVISFFDKGIEDLNNRTKDVPESQRKSVYIGGVARAGPHGLHSTEPGYPPFIFVNANNVASALGSQGTEVAKEKIVEWDPDILFVDIATIQLETDTAIDELKKDSAYKKLSAVKSGEVYAVIPYNWYNANQGSVLADAYFVGKVIYPEKFSDIDPVKKADEIYTFLFGKAVFSELNSEFNNIGFKKLDI